MCVRCLQALLNDCKDLDPTIRGLAVRSMCSLRVPELMENVVSGWCLLACLACMGALRLPCPPVHLKLFPLTPCTSEPHMNTSVPPPPCSSRRLTPGCATRTPMCVRPR